MPLNNTLNAYGMAIYPAMLLALFSKSELHWEMHSAQLFSLEIAALQCVPTTVVMSEEKKSTDIELLPLHTTAVTLLGFPVKIDNDKYPKNLVRLMWGDREVGRIEGLAVPAAYPGLPDFDLEQKVEKEKFQKLTY